MSILSERLKRFSPSLTVKISQKARELRDSGKEIISLSSGEPDFDTPKHIKNDAIKAINSGFTKYTTVDGVNELKNSIIKKFNDDNNINYSPNQITVGVGGKHVIYNLFMSTINKSDEVIMSSPYWVSYPEIVNLCGGKPKIINTDEANGFKISASQIESAITKKTKWLILNSPSNPTGAVFSKEELKNISKVLLKNPKIWILSDDIYEYLIYDKFEFSNILNVEPKLYDRTFIVNGVSKAFSMTGWRIGYGAGSETLISSIANIQSQSTTNPTSISQMAAISALKKEKFFLKDWIYQFNERRLFITNYLNGINGLSCIVPSGAFYVFVSCKKLIGRKTPDNKIIKSDIDFVEFLLEFAGVAVVPGAAFGKTPYFRISYASSMNLLNKACKKISEALDLLN